MRLPGLIFQRSYILVVLVLFPLILFGCLSDKQKQIPTHIVPSLSPVFSPSQVQNKPENTATPGMLPNPQSQSIDGPFLLEYDFGGNIYLQDIATGGIRKLNSEYKISTEEGFLGWTKNSCGFYARIDNHNILEIDLAGEVIREVFQSKNQYQSNDEYISPWVKISPGEKFIAYYVGNGPRDEVEGFGYHYQEEELLVSPISGDAFPTVISKNGGVRNFGWSEDGQTIIFTDYDEKDLLQIFVSTIDGKVPVKISNFQLQSDVPNDFIWSKDNRFVAVIYANQRPWQIFVYDILKSTVTFAEYADNAWWNDDGTLAILVNNSLKTINPEEGLVLQNRTVPQFTLQLMRWDQDYQLACLGDCVGKRQRMLVIYDVNQTKITEFPQVVPIPDLAGWHKSSLLFPGEANCN